MTKENVLKELEVILGFATEIIMNGIKIEDITIEGDAIKVYYSTPEKYEDGLIDEVENIEKRNKEIVQEYVVNILSEWDKIDTQMLSKEDYDDMKNYIKYYCKTRTGECWTEEKSQNEIEKYIKEVKEKLNVIFDKFSRYKEV